MHAGKNLIVIISAIHYKQCVIEKGGTSLYCLVCYSIGGSIFFFVRRMDVREKSDWIVFRINHTGFCNKVSVLIDIFR